MFHAAGGDNDPLSNRQISSILNTNENCHKSMDNVLKGEIEMPNRVLDVNQAK